MDVPTKVFATELTVSVATPKSHSLIMPRELTSTFDGLMSRCMMRCASYRYTKPPRMDSVILPSTSTRMGPKSFEMRSRDLHVVSAWTWKQELMPFSPAIHIFHAKHDVPCFVLKGAVECDHVGRIAIVTDLQFSDNLFSHILFCIDSY